MVNKRGIKPMSANILKKVRKDLGIKQRELSCEKIKNISRFESGEMELSPSSAVILCKKIKGIMKERDLVLDYEITPELLLGKTTFITDELIQQLNKSIKTPYEVLERIDSTLTKLDDDNAINLIKNTIIILNNEAYLNAQYISEYCYRLLKYSISDEFKIDIYNYLIKSNFILCQYETIIAICKSIINDVLQYGSIEQKEKFFINMANSYFELRQCDECEKTLRYIRKYKDYELQGLTLSAICKTLKNDIEGSRKIYESIINLSRKSNNICFIINSYSNLADIYKDIDIDASSAYIKRAIELISEDVDKQFIFNVYYNYLLININLNDIAISEELFKLTFDLANELKNKGYQNKTVKSIISLYRQNNQHAKIYNIIKYLKNNCNYMVDSDIIIETLKELDDKDLIYDIINITK